MPFPAPLHLHTNVFLASIPFLFPATFTTLTGEWVSISHNVLCLKTIVNYRRSGPCIEPFNLELSYSTSFQQIETLRSKMIAWLGDQPQRRHFLPGLDIKILNLGGSGSSSIKTIGSGIDATNDQKSMSLSIDIRYRSNLQSQELLNKRRNLWICQLKVFLAEIQLIGAGGTSSTPIVNKDRTQGDGNREYKFLDEAGKGGSGQSPWTGIPDSLNDRSIDSSKGANFTSSSATATQSNPYSISNQHTLISQETIQNKRIWAGQT